MKKKIWIPIMIVAVLVILLIPIPTGVYRDGGTRVYSALTYKIKRRLRHMIPRSLIT